MLLHRRQLVHIDLAYIEAADPAKVWRLLYFARAESVSVTAARATLLLFINATIGRLLSSGDMHDRHFGRNPEMKPS